MLADTLAILFLAVTRERRQADRSVGDTDPGMSDESAAQWSMGDLSSPGLLSGQMRTAEVARVRGQVWHGRYWLSGEASGAPRMVDYWTDGRSTRAEGKDGAAWIEGPLGEVVRYRGALNVQEIPWGQGGLLSSVPPFPEMQAIRSVHGATLWLDVPGTHRPKGSAEVLGRPVTEYSRPGLLIQEDDETGLVLSLRAEGLRGIVELSTLQVAWEPRGPAQFSLAGRSVAS